MAYIKLKDPTSFIIKKQVVRVEKLVGQKNKFKDVAFKKKIKLTENQETKIIETCLDWLIQDEKVAAKAYSMITLYNFGKKYSWINEELKTILLQDYF